jgi:hypothetical protein
MANTIEKIIPSPGRLRGLPAIAKERAVRHHRSLLSLEVGVGRLQLCDSRTEVRKRNTSRHGMR